MKIDKKNPWHWLYLLVSGMWMAVVIVLRPFRSKKDQKIVVLYGHKFNGNLKAFADYAATQKEVQCYFLTMDPAYYKQLVLANPSVPILLMTRLADMLIVGRSDAVITDHGLHSLALLHKLTDARFIDVWHGIPYKGFTPESLGFLKDYDDMWMSSQWMRRFYMKAFGFKPEQIHATGYARVDALVNGTYDPAVLRQKYGIDPQFKKVILVAPTWQHDDAGHSIVPFGVSEQDFFEGLNAVGKKLNALVIFRAHLNVADATGFASLPFVKNMPYAQYPDAEEFLAISDVLVTDWSSLAFDFLPLHRPTIFLDVPPPFKNGFIVGPQYRFGDIVGSFEALIASIERGVKDPQGFAKTHAKIIKQSEELAYGSTQDGRAAERCYQRLRSLLQ